MRNKRNQREPQVANFNSDGWSFFVKICFAISVTAMSVAIFFIPTNVWIKGYLAMGILFTVASSFMLSKSMRDEFEASKLHNRIYEAKTERILQEVDTLSP